ncbi:MAG: DNA-deoxyinosine glycosylase [Spirochaetales bacterium]|nr:DNA-deoxyinosine glycosylase [Spirochaetales bacterium]
MKTPTETRASTNHQTITHPLMPVFQADSKILILGSFPSVKTREYGFFYGHPQNRFWPLLERIFGVKPLADIEDKRAFLLQHHLALYDVIYRCDIIGSGDASIRNVVPSDLSPMLKEADIRHVFCNGGTAYRFYQQYQERKTGYEAIQLPSTSPANARYSLDDLYDRWKILGELSEPSFHPASL